MYRNLNYYKDIHILIKIFSIFVYTLGIILIQNPILAFLLAFFFFLFFRNFYSFLLFLFFFILSFWIPVSFVVSKSLLVFSFILLNFFTIHFQDIRQFIEYFSYSNKPFCFSYKILYICYFCKYYFIHFQEFFVLRKCYGTHLSLSFLKYVIMQSFYKTKSKIASLMKTYQYRFYNFYKKRTYVEKNKITTLDLKYILIVVLLFLIIYFCGR